VPFDNTIGVDTDPQNANSLTIETDGSEFVPDLHHIADDLVLLSDGSVLAMAKGPRYPFELESMGARNIRRRQVNDLVKGLADNNVVISFHLCHHHHVEPLAHGRFRSGFARRLFDKYERNVLDGKLVANDWFITVVVSPRFSPGRAMRRKFGSWFGLSADASGSESVVRQTNSIMQSLMAYFGQDGGKRLGLRRSPEGYQCSEIAEARRLILTGRWQPIPLTTGTLGASIYTDRITCGTKASRPGRGA
jgi:type IV secretion system protein VirB4